MRGDEDQARAEREERRGNPREERLGTPRLHRGDPGNERLGTPRLHRGDPRKERLGTPRLHLRSTDSTNERARSLALAGAPHGTLVSADVQTAGRGRHGRSWVAPPRACLLCSLLLRGAFGCPPARGLQGAPSGVPSAMGGAGRAGEDPPASLLPLIAGVAVCDAIGPGARLKWPNDVVLGEGLAKVAGILVEARPRPYGHTLKGASRQDGWAVVGIGVNVAVRLEDLPADVRGRAASLGRPASAVEPLLADLLAALSARLVEPAAQALERWRALDALRGREVAWGEGGNEGCGVAEGTDEEGRLLVRVAGKGERVALSAGDVHLSTTG